MDYINQKVAIKRIMQPRGGIRKIRSMEMCQIPHLLILNTPMKHTNHVPCFQLRLTQCYWGFNRYAWIRL